MKQIESLTQFLERSFVWKVWAFIIVLLSLMPKGAIKPFSITDLVGIDKIGHFTFYAVLVFLYQLSHKNRKTTRLFEKNTFLLLCIVSFYSFLIELSQSSNLLGRNFDILDLIANIAGSICGVFIYNFLIHKLKHKNYA